MRKSLAALLACCSLNVMAFDGARFSDHRDDTLFDFDVCFISETHRDWNFRSGEVKKALAKGKRVCSISIPQPTVSTAESRYIRNRVSEYLKRINPDRIYLPRIHEDYIKRLVGDKDIPAKYVFVEPPDTEMAKLLANILRDFNMDAMKLWILYDPTTVEDKRAWLKVLKPFKPTIVNVKTKNSLRRYLRKINKSREAGVIVNLMSSVEDAEYSRYMRYEEIKYELQTQNRLHLTVGVEETRNYNEAIVFDYDDVDSKVRAFVNKDEFDRVRLKSLYLNSNWQYLGGFLGGRGTN